MKAQETEEKIIEEDDNENKDDSESDKKKKKKKKKKKDEENNQKILKMDPKMTKVNGKKVLGQKILMTLSRNLRKDIWKQMTWEKSQKILRMRKIKRSPRTKDTKRIQKKYRKMKKMIQAKNPKKIRTHQKEQDQVYLVCGIAHSVRTRNIKTI